MYRRILVPVENSNYDERILDHVRQLAHYCGASVVLIHVADGWAARNIQHLNLRESEEMRGDREYIERLAAKLSADGVERAAEVAERLLREIERDVQLAASQAAETALDHMNRPQHPLRQERRDDRGDDERDDRRLRRAEQRVYHLLAHEQRFASQAA